LLTRILKNKAGSFVALGAKLALTAR
jgi:hypothetical protein